MKYLITILLLIITSCTNDDIGNICGKYKHSIENNYTTTIYISHKSDNKYYIQLEHDDYTADPSNRIFIFEGSFTKIPSDSVKYGDKNIGFVSFSKNKVTILSTSNNKTYFGEKYE